MPPSKKKTYTIKDNSIGSDLKITKTTLTTLGRVGDLATASKRLMVKLVDNRNNNVNDLLHDEDVSRFVKSYTRDQA